MNTAVYNIATDQIWFYPEKRLAEDEYKVIKEAGYKWHHFKSAFVATWTPYREDA